MKILLFDIETAPNLGYVWGRWEQDVISFQKDWYILSCAYKWLGEKNVNVVSLPDFKRAYRKDRTNDADLCRELWRLFDTADVVIAHNGDAFDIKKANARFVQHGLNPPTPYKSIDTKLEAKKYFKFDSNRLDDLGQYLGLGRKMMTGGFDLWLGCMAGDKKAWEKMCAYNKRDVELLEKVYLKLRGWMKHPNYNVVDNSTSNCPNCNSPRIQRRGVTVTRTSKRQRFQCQDCGAWSQGEAIKIGKVVR